MTDLFKDHEHSTLCIALQHFGPQRSSTAGELVALLQN